jgi:ribosomal protein S18 acetylase RimI-like enzyme
MSGNRLDQASVLARAFARDPLMAFALPEPGVRHRKLTPLFRPILRASVRFGGIACDKQRRAVAAWVGMKHFPVGALDLLRSGVLDTLKAIGWSPILRIKDHESHCEEALKRLAPPHSAYLWAVGVLPEHRGHGHGGRIVRHVLDAMAAEGHKACLLKTENLENVPLYEALGFETLDRVVVSSSGLPVWVMGRPI